VDDNVTPIDKPRKPRRPKGIVPVSEPGMREHELRLQGKSWVQIAQATGLETARAAQFSRERYLQRAGLELAQEKRAEALQLEIERLDTLQAAYWTAAITGLIDPEYPGIELLPDVKAAEVVLKIIALRAKMLGLDETDQTAVGPRTVVITGNTDQYIAGLKDLIAQEGTVIIDADVVDDDD